MSILMKYETLLASNSVLTLQQIHCRIWCFDDENNEFIPLIKDLSFMFLQDQIISSSLRCFKGDVELNYAFRTLTPFKILLSLHTNVSIVRLTMSIRTGTSGQNYLR